MSYPSRGRARIGVLVPFTNTNLEADMTMLCPSGVTMHYARLGGYDMDEIPDEKQMAELGASDLSEPLRLLAGARPDVIMYGCTSATLTHGPEFDSGLSRNILNNWNIPTITAAGALVYALKSLEIKKIGFASPYVRKINQDAINFLQKEGFQTVSSAHVNDDLDNYGQGSLTPEKVCDLARQANSEQAQAIVLSCTDMRAAEVINQLEGELGKPVITSNQAMLFNALQYISVTVDNINCGALFKTGTINHVQT